MTFGQFFLGLIAICVATVVYRWQKSVDRETSILSEQRQLYAKYVTASKAFYLSQPFKGVLYSEQEINSFFQISESEADLYGLRDQIFLLAPVVVVDAVEAHDTAFRNWKIAFPKENNPTEKQLQDIKSKDDALRNSYQHMLVVMRKNLKLHGSYSLQNGLLFSPRKQK